MAKYLIIVNTIIGGQLMFGTYGLTGGIVIGWLLFREMEDEEHAKLNQK